MLVLGISSAIAILDVALVDKNAVLAESCDKETLRAEKLPELIDRVLKKSGKVASDLDAVAVTAGPGSYGGLRGGIAVAKALCQSLDIPVVGVPTLDAVARGIDASEGSITVAAPACKGEYNVAVFSASKGGLKRISGDSISKSKPDAQGLFIVGQEDVFPRARSVALIGIERLKGSEKSDVLELSPRYSHDPNIREFNS